MRIGYLKRNVKFRKEKKFGKQKKVKIWIGEKNIDIEVSVQERVEVNLHARRPSILSAHYR